MQGLNNPIGIKSSEPSQSPFITNPYRFGVASPWDFEDDFSTSTNWTDNGGKQTVSAGALQWSATGDGNRDTITADVIGGTVSDTAWVLRYKFDIATVSVQSVGNHITFGMSSEPYTSDFGAAQDSLNLKLFVRTTANRYSNSWGDNTNVNGANDTAQNTVTVTTHYMEQIRLTSTTFSNESFSDSGFSSSNWSKTSTVPSTIQNLRYFKVADNGTSATTSTLDGTLDDIQFEDGVTTAP